MAFPHVNVLSLKLCAADVCAMAADKCITLQATHMPLELPTGYHAMEAGCCACLLALHLPEVCCQAVKLSLADVHVQWWLADAHVLGQDPAAGARPAAAG